MKSSINTYITYSELLAMLHPYFLMSGGEDFMTTGELPIQINLAIQDLMNNSSFSFMSEFDTLEPEPELYKGHYRIFKTEFPINRVHELLLDGDPGTPGELVNRMPYFSSPEVFYKRGTNILYGPKDCDKMTINYEKEYIRNNIVTAEDLKRELPIPYSFVPALMKMIYDNSSMFTFFQGEGESADYYGHGKTRLNDLVNSDDLSSKTNVKIGAEL